MKQGQLLLFIVSALAITLLISVRNSQSHCPPVLDLGALRPYCPACETPVCDKRPCPAAPNCPPPPVHLDSEMYAAENEAEAPPPVVEPSVRNAIPPPRPIPVAPRLAASANSNTQFTCYQSADWAEICVYNVLCTDGKKVVLVDDTQPEGQAIWNHFGVGDDSVGYHVFDVYPRPPPASKGLPLNTRGTGYTVSSKSLANAEWTDRSMWFIFPETNAWEIQHLFFYSHMMFPLWEARESNDTWGGVLPPIEDVYVMAQRRYKFNDWNNNTLAIMLPPGGKQHFIDDLAPYSPERLLCTRRGVVSGNKPFVFSGMKPAWNFRNQVFTKFNVTTTRHPPKKLLVYNRANAGRRFENIDEMEALFKRYDIPYTIINKVGTFADQVKAMSEAGVLLLSHGAAATNTIFQQHRSVLIEVFPYLRKRFGFMSIAQVIGNFYYPLFSWQKGWTGKTVMNETTWLTSCEDLASIYTNKVGVCDAAQKVVVIRVDIPALERILVDAFDTIGYRIYDNTKVASLVVFVLYHVSFWSEAKNDTSKSKTSRGLMDGVRSGWVKQHRGKGVLPVNTIGWACLKSGNFFGTTSIVIVASSLSLARSNVSGCLPKFGLESSPSQTCSPESALFLTKILVLAANFFLAFLQFVYMLRFFVNCSFLMNTQVLSDGTSISTDVVVEQMRRGFRRWAFGIRHIYFSFPLAVWFAGPVPMFLSTIALVSFLHWFDHLPDSVPPDFAAQFERHHSDEVHTGNSK